MLRKRLKAVVVAGIMGLAFYGGSGNAFAHEGHDHNEAVSEHQGDACPVTGEAIEQKGQYTYEYQGKVYNFCCPDCLATFKKNPEKYVGKAKVEKGGAAPKAAVSTSESSAADTRYGVFGLLDHRSRYGQFWFPEPFRMGETDVDNEVRFDWVHQGKRGYRSDEVTVELEKAFGLTTFELEIPYQNQATTTTDPGTGVVSTERTHGVGNIELSVRRPIYQFVSRSGFFDNTIGAGLEVGLPTDSPVSKNTELVGKIFDALRLGEHFSLQSVGGYSALLGPGEEGGNRTFEYSMLAGYSFTRKDFALPHIEEITPMLEVKGERGLSGTEEGHNNISGTAGVRVNLNAIGPLQPRLGVGYVFPIDKGARDEFKWGVATSIVFEY